MTLADVVARFNTTPFLFVGSGITKRYYGLPSWEELLRSFAERISSDRFAYTAYKTKAQDIQTTNGPLPMAATLIQKDFDEKWFSDESIRQLDDKYLDFVENGVSPFKAEIASLIEKNSVILPSYIDEITRLKNISKKNIAGIITTNYDLFFENLFDGYKSYVGQNELVFSPIQGVAEIYKIHGSITKPASIVINDHDYTEFSGKSKYLAAKLMTIFMEYPIIFIGYSITDANIRNILSDIAECLPDEKFNKLQERFVFIEYKPDTKGALISPFSIDLNGRLLNMTRITMDNFGLLYDALASKEAKISIRLLRRFKEDIFSYVISSQPGPLMQVAQLDDKNIDEDRLCISIGLSNTGEYGLKSFVDSNKWYRDIITGELDSLGFTLDQRLDLSFSSAFKGATGCFPVHKYLSGVEGNYPLVESHAARKFDDLISNTIKKNRSNLNYSSVHELWNAEKTDLKRATRLLGYLTEDKCDVDELYEVLRQILESNENVLNGNTELSINLRRLIRIYDFLRWGKKRPQ